ncbi:MAG TPA: S41 family peptidase [Gemmatimonadaceae bacterium]
MRSRAVVVLSVLGMSLVSGGWLLQKGMEDGGRVLDRARLFDDVFEHVSQFYVDSVPQSSLYEKAVDGLLRELHDPHSVYLTGERLRRLTESTTGNYAGVGIQIDVRNGWITVVSALPGTPAERAGLEGGDRIVAIDSVGTEGWSSDEASRVLRGPEGTRVVLTIERPGVAQRFPVPVQRREIHVPSVQHAVMLEPGTGYIDLTVFSENSAEEIERAVERLRDQGMRELILDLRDNPGGLLDQGVAVSDLFLDRGDMIVSMRGRTPDANREFLDRAAQRWSGLPMVVLVNENSASASEIVAGALQDHDRAVIVGRTSYGKGSAQSLFPLSGGGALKLTTALWFTPVGRSINKKLSDDDAEQLALDLPEEVPSGERTPYRTETGRTVYGGGGITPDVAVSDSIRSAEELALTRALGTDVAKFRDALTAQAMSMKVSRAVRTPDFTIGPSTLDAFRERLERSDVAIADDLFDDSRDVITRLLTYEVARYVFGPEVEFLRRARSDDVVQTAVRLVKGAPSQQALFERAQQYPTDVAQLQKSGGGR